MVVGFYIVDHPYNARDFLSLSHFHKETLVDFLETSELKRLPAYIELVAYHAYITFTADKVL